MGKPLQEFPLKARLIALHLFSSVLFLTEKNVLFSSQNCERFLRLLPSLAVVKDAEPYLPGLPLGLASWIELGKY